MNYLEDDCGNKINLDKYTKEQAIAMLDSLINCDNCIDCYDCVNCISCEDCINCRNINYGYKVYDDN